MDIQRNEASGTHYKTKVLQNNYPITSEQISQIIEWLLEAKNPVIIAGHGVLLSQAQNELRELAHLFNIPVSQSMLGIGAFPSNDPLCLGFHGHTGNRRAGEAIYNSDFLLVLGSRLDVRQTGTLFKEFAPNAKIVHVDIDKTELDYRRVPATMSIQTDCRTFLKCLLSNIAGEKSRVNSDKVILYGSQKQIEIHPVESNENPTFNQFLSQVDVIRAVDELTKREKVVVTTGVGLHQSFVARHFTFDWPNRVLLTSGGHGAMGFDLPAAIGAALEMPDHKIICFVGDGSFQMNLQEMATIREYRLPIMIIIFNNNRLGLVGQFMGTQWGHELTCDNKWNPRFEDIAKSYEIPGFRCTNIDDIKNAHWFTTWSKRDRNSTRNAILLNCICDPDENISPMLLGGQRIDQPWERDE
jgi:acetolactate synthase-1/2/3 large subunit